MKIIKTNSMMQQASLDFIEDVFEKFTEEITDRIFLFIEEDKDGLFQRYLDTVSREDRQLLNSAIGEKVNAYFGLQNKVDSQGNKVKGEPKSSLIKTEYTKHVK